MGKSPNPTKKMAMYMELQRVRKSFGEMGGHISIPYLCDIAAKPFFVSGAYLRQVVNEVAKNYDYYRLAEAEAQEILNLLKSDDGGTDK